MTVKINIERIKTEIKGKLEDYLKSEFQVNPERNISCLNPAHDDIHPSMSLLPDKLSVYCRACSAHYDIFDLIGMKHNTSDFKEIFDIACRMYGYTNPYKKLEEAKEEQSHQKEKKQSLKAIVTAVNKPKSKSKEDIFKEQEVYTKNIQDELLWYMLECNNNLLNNEKALNYLFKHKGINKDTVDFVGMGIDTKKRKWTLPIFKYSTNIDCYIIGFEYRNPDFDIGKPKKEISRYRYKKDDEVYSMPSGLANINTYTPTTSILAVIEGYIDGYLLHQHLTKANQAQYYHIATPSSGVSSLINQIKSVDFDKYKKFYLFVDNDTAGDSVAEKIIEKYPFFERFKCGCKDFGEWYMKNCLAQ